ncbi:NAD-dependent epimerase/dehydratase family protein [Mesorhizobium sp. M1D.F.Ca.ET.043.01.1.1]|nr:NAD-dependent epimerase/dehydratase family protein [Mesorhizobium sp. M1D.F.Ca.ET.043.01.1.1]
MSALVTGNAGLIGSHVCQRLLDRGDTGAASMA